MKRPIHTQKPGYGSDNGGWRPSLADLWTQLLAEIHALRARASAELDGVRGVPAVYQGIKVFEPADRDVDLGAEGVVTPVLLDGNTYDIPIYFPGPGVFVARSLEVNVYQRWYPTEGGGWPDPPQEFWLLARQFSTALANNATNDGAIRTTRVSRLLNLPAVSADNEEPVPALQFWWNLLDSKSQRYLADNLMPQQVLQPMTNTQLAPPDSVAVSVPAFPLDGGRFCFDAPWLVERDGQMRFQFRPTTLICQDASINTLPQVKNVLAQTVKVQVELHGERYETLQDAVRSGALTRPVRAEEE